MSDAARKTATYQDLLNAPSDMIAEILDGELVLHPRPAPPHADTSSAIVADLAPVRRRKGNPPGGGWRILFEPELHLGTDIAVPDVAGWRRERLPRLPKRSTLLTVAPDWVCEVLSPSTVQHDRAKKARMYARHRVEHLWLVDPAAQVLEVYQLAGEFWQQVAVCVGTEVVHVPPFEQLELDLAEWWEEEADEDGE